MTAVTPKTQWKKYISPQEKIGYRISPNCKLFYYLLTISSAVETDQTLQNTALDIVYNIL